MIEKIMELYKEKTKKDCYKIEIEEGVTPSIMDDKIGGIPSKVCSNPVTNPHSNPAPKPANIAKATPPPLVIIIEATTPPTTKLPSTVKSGMSKIL